MSSRAESIAQAAMTIPGRVREKELAELARWAARVPRSGRIVEIGSLYGRSTVALAQATAGIVIAVDNFCDIHGKPPSLPLLHDNLLTHKLHNVLIWDCDSHAAGRQWVGMVNMLFVDGGHSYQTVQRDLAAWGASVIGTIAAHDYTPGFPTVQRAVDDWLAANEEWGLVSVVESLAVLRKRGK